MITQLRDLILRDLLPWEEAFVKRWLGVLAGGLTVTIAVGTLLITITANQVGAPVPGTGGDTIRIVPASGVEGFNTERFCADPLTQVRQFISPDASGVTYQLMRVRDGVAETVTVVYAADSSVLVAQHYYDTATAGQQSEPAILNVEAQKCMRGKAKG